MPGSVRGDDSRWRLRGQRERELLDEELHIGFRLRVMREVELPVIGGRDTDIDHLCRFELLEQRARG